MAEEKLIQISLQIPASELAGITALVEQVRHLLQDDKKAPVSQTDAEKNTGFDEERFQALQQAEREVPSPVVESAPETPPTVSFSENLTGSTLPDSSTETMPDIAELNHAVTAEDIHFSTEKEIPTLAPQGFAELEGAVDLLWGSPERDKLFTDTASEVSSSPRLHEAEQALITAPSPLTAEGVSLAFRRDDRRYDNGFPLY